MTEIDWYRIAGEAWAKCDASLWGDDDGPDPTVVAAAALGPGLRAAVDAVLATARADQWRAGYDAAVEEMRGVVVRTGSPAANWAALYLASQREYVERRGLDGASVGAPRLIEGGHVWSPYGDIQQCVNCHLTRAAYFHTGARRSCPRRLDSSETPPAAPEPIPCDGLPAVLPSRGCCQAGYQAFPEPCPWHTRAAPVPEERSDGEPCATCFDAGGWWDGAWVNCSDCWMSTDPPRASLPVDGETT